MKNIIFTTFIMFACSIMIYPQTSISINLGYGNYFSNSENSLYVMRDDKYRSYLFYGISLQNANILGYNLILEYSYHRTNKDNIVQFVRTAETDPTPLGYFNGDIILLSHTFDLDIAGNLNKYLSCGIGPSFEIINRTFKVNFPPAMELSLNDRLASSALGVNAFINFSYPLWEGENNIYITSQFKIRYTHSIWFDKGNRNLDNYSQEFLTGQVSAGLGYSF